jgi:Mn2+/Fe2+ NRAMP family transporter
MIASLIGSILFSIVLVLYLLLALGLPYGEYAMGGKHKILPGKERIICIISVTIQSFAILILLQGGSVIRLGFSDRIVSLLCYFFAVYLSFNVLLNLLSKSKKEKLFMTPLSFVIAICFWLTALNL